MLDWLLTLFLSSSLTNEESKSANEAKQRALNFVNDALKKKESLLVDDPDMFGDGTTCRLFTLLSTDLVKDLISHLQKVTFRRNKDPEKEKSFIAYVYSSSETEIYLCKGFWELSEFLASMVLIHEVSHLLGYGHTIGENKEKVKKSPQYKLYPVSVCNIEEAFSIYMNHRGTYTNGSYSCCGETSRDSVCENSTMRYILTYEALLWGFLSFLLDDFSE